MMPATVDDALLHFLNLPHGLLEEIGEDYITSGDADAVVKKYCPRIDYWYDLIPYRVAIQMISADMGWVSTVAADVVLSPSETLIVAVMPFREAMEYILRRAREHAYNPVSGVSWARNDSYEVRAIAQNTGVKIGFDEREVRKFLSNFHLPLGEALDEMNRLKR